MTEELKKLIESVPTLSQIEISMLSVTTEFVRKSDFDRIVEELTRWNKVEDIQPTGNIERSVLYKTKRGDISSICFKGCNSVFIRNWFDEMKVTEWKYII